MAEGGGVLVSYEYRKLVTCPLADATAASSNCNEEEEEEAAAAPVAVGTGGRTGVVGTTPALALVLIPLAPLCVTAI